MQNRILTVILIFLVSLCVAAQTDRDHVRRGNRLMRDTLFAKAQVEYQKAIEKDNTNAIAHYNMGNALMYQNKAEDALKEFDTATKFEKNKIRLSKMYHNMGVLFQSAKQYDKALACYKNSLRNNPVCNETRYNYALCLYMLKNGAGQDNQNQQQDQNGKDEKKEQQKQEQQKQDKKNEQKQKEEPKPDMSKENAEQMLKAAMQDEKSTQEKLQRALQQPQKKHLQKQW